MKQNGPEFVTSYATDLAARAAGPTDAVLVRAAQAGDAAAYGQLYERYRDPVYRFCLARTASPHEAEDLVGDVFLRTMEALGRYQERGLPFLAFLYRVARNAVIDRGRRSRPVVSVEALLVEPESSHSVESEAARSFERDVLVAALARLKPAYREVLLLRLVEGYSAAEAGKLLARSEGAVRTLQHRGLERLRKEIERGGKAHLFADRSAREAKR